MSGMLERLTGWLRHRAEEAREAAAGGIPIATPPGGEERETSTDAQVAGAADQPWPGND